jgi:putative nucleotidyltransferase with HDIG domain
MEERLGKSKPIAIGRLNPDGTFKLKDTLYGAKVCLYHISWSTKVMWYKRLFYELFVKPKVLSETIEEMERENDLIAQKYEELYEKNLELQQHYVDTINAFIRAIDAKDHYTQDHSLNVARIAEALAKELGLGNKKIEHIRQACKLHDLGKIGIKDGILLKPGKLSEEEWEEIKKHPVLGAEIIRPLTFLSEVALLIRQDHERWDGKGYPDGIKGEEIDIGARIIAVADAYDAMVSGRVYKKAMDKHKAIEEIRKNAGTQFDPQVVEVLVKCLAK